MPFWGKGGTQVSGVRAPAEMASTVSHGVQNREFHGRSVSLIRAVDAHTTNRVQVRVPMSEIDLPRVRLRNKKDEYSK
jgi:hypothetical protein